MRDLCRQLCGGLRPFFAAVPPRLTHSSCPRRFLSRLFPSPLTACRDVQFGTAASLQSEYSCVMPPDTALRAEFNGLVLKIEREMVVHAHFSSLLAATTARIDVLRGDMETTRRRLQRARHVAKPRRR